MGDTTHHVPQVSQIHKKNHAVPSTGSSQRLDEWVDMEQRMDNLEVQSLTIHSVPSDEVQSD